MMRINDPAVLAELKFCHQVYERARAENDTATLDSLLQDSPQAVRFGETDLVRQILRVDVTAFGDAAGIIDLEFMRLVEGVERHGRETQSWFRFPEGWRIASLHISLLPMADPYIKAACEKIGLRISPADYAAVGADLNRAAVMADFMMQFPLSQNIEAAPVFEP